jgi:methionyl-tRNA formyltransferase
MRTVYLGTAEFAAAVLRRLADSAHRPALVVTRPDSPRGRGRRLSSPPVAQAARELGLALDQPASVNDQTARDRIAAARPEALCVCAFGALIKEPLLSDHLIFNVHPSLAPRWRGAAPIERAIMAGDERTGVSILRMTAGLDSGPVCLQAPEPILPDDTYGMLAQRLQELSGELLIRVLDGLPTCAEQDDALATYADKIAPEDRVLDGSRRPAIELERVVRALTPHVGARVELGDGTWLGVQQARALAGDPDPSAAAGSVSLIPPRPVLSCIGGALELLVVKPPGKNEMSGEEYLRGRRR